jgi:hypothetical protein
MPICEFEIGTTLVGLVNLEELTVPVIPPRSRWQKYAEVVDLGDASTRGFSLPSGSWVWDFIVPAQRDQLRTFCPGSSSTVFIRTKKRDDVVEEYAEYQVKMLWPAEEEYELGRIMNFEIRFRDMMEQP